MAKPIRVRCGTNPPEDFEGHAQAIADRFGARAYADPDELLEEGSDERPLIEVLYDDQNGVEVTIWDEREPEEVRRIFAEMASSGLRTTLSELRVLHAPGRRSTLTTQP